MQVVDVKFDLKRIFNHLVNLYPEPFDVFRELLQNSIDAGASKVEIIVKDNIVIVRDNGYGIDLEAFRTIGTDFKARLKKKGENIIGEFGIGRLSVFNLADVVTWRSRGMRITWDISKPLKLNIERDCYSKGTEVILRLKPDVKIDVNKLREYIEETIYAPIDIIVNDVKIRNKLRGLTCIQGKLCKIYINKEMWNESATLVKGVMKVGTDSDLAGIIVADFNITSGRNLYRDSFYYAVKEECAKMLIKLFIKKKWSPNKAIRILFWVHVPDDLKEKAFREIRVLCQNRHGFHVKSLYELKNMKDKSKMCYLSDSDDLMLRERLIMNDYTVITTNNYMLENLLRSIGIQDAKTIPEDELRMIVKARSLRSKSLKRAIINIWEALQEITPLTVVKDAVVLKTIENTQRKRQKVKFNDVLVKSGENTTGRKRNAFKNLSKLEILETYSDDDFIACIKGNKLVLNMKKPIVQKILRSKGRKRLTLLVPIIVHEYVHYLGYDEHNENFYKVYEQLLLSTLYNML